MKENPCTSCNYNGGGDCRKICSNYRSHINYQQGISEERERIVAELEEAKSLVPVNRLLDDIINDKPKELGMLIAYDKALEIVRCEE